MTYWHTTCEYLKKYPETSEIIYSLLCMFFRCRLKHWKMPISVTLKYASYCVEKILSISEYYIHEHNIIIYWYVLLIMYQIQLVDRWVTLMPFYIIKQIDESKCRDSQVQYILIIDKFGFGGGRDVTRNIVCRSRDRQFVTGDKIKFLNCSWNSSLLAIAHCHKNIYYIYYNIIKILMISYVW